jgi:RsiW-degrading membrane proteinase PrsW (M82 family)
MSGIRQRRVWLLIAAIAIVAVLLLLFVPQVHSGNGSAWCAVLPIFFIGLLFPLSTPRCMEDLFSGRALESPFQRISFQRPPPFRLV